jgi:type VI secretion system protein ImpC
MPQRLQFDFTFSKDQEDVSARQRTNGAMRILIMGDFSGRNNRGLHESGDKLASRSIVPVDFDNFNDTMARLAPQLCLPIGETAEPGMSIQFAQLDDFHPDVLYRNLELFRALRELRTRLMDPASFPQAAAELRHDAQSPQQIADSSGQAAGDTEPALEEDEASMLERLLGGQRSETSDRPSSTNQTQSQHLMQQFIQGIVGPYIVPGADPSQPHYVAAVDEAISEQMRAVLHHTDFQALEALWRSVHNLVTGLELDQDLMLYLLDTTVDELTEDIKATQGQLEESGLYHRLVENGTGTLGGESWSMLVGDYTFTTDVESLSLLAALGAIGSQAGAPFLATAGAGMLGCSSVIETPDPREWKNKDPDAEQAWQALRQSSAARWIGLAHPRLLLRLPYGKDSDALDYFEFEELGQPAEHESYLWGNPAFACAMLIAKAYQANGWSMELGDILDLEDLPAHTFKHDDESKMMACAEEYLTERAAEAMLDHGLMPLISYRNRNAVRLMRFQSIAEPLKMLSGPWA